MAGDPLSAAYALGNTEFKDPSEILSCLSELMVELSQAIEYADLDALAAFWKTQDPETLAKGYKAFRNYQEMSAGSDNFELFCSYIAAAYAKIV